MIDEAHVRYFGQAYRGGKWDAAQTSGTLPAGVAGSSVATASLRWEPICDDTGSCLVDSSGNPVMAVVDNP